MAEPSRVDAAGPAPWMRLAAFALAALAILGFRAVAPAFYGGFRVPQGSSGFHVPVEELAYLFLFLALGGVAWLALAVALHRLPTVEGLAGAGARLAARPGWCTAIAALGLLAASSFVASQVLGHAVVTDDEHVYRFIARTLAGGALTAPSPGQDLSFFKEQYVVLTEHARYGKYPIGHPLLLMLGLKARLDWLVVPAITALCALPVAWIGARLFGRTAAALAVFLLLCSPQVVLTGGTALSQPASALCLLLGLACLLAADDARGRDRRRELLCLAAAGTAFGYGVLVRPVPGVLFVAVAAGFVLWRTRTAGTARALQAALALAAPVAACGAVFLAVNAVQTGDALTSAYQTSHGTGAGVRGGLRFLGGGLAAVTMSVAGGLLRLNAWAFGWPVCLLAWWWARRGRGPALLIAMIGAEVAYRVVAPKTVVAATGPVYFFESVPLVCLLAAGGAAELVRERRSAGGVLVSAGTVAAVVLAGLTVSLTMFVPYKIADLQRMGWAQHRPFALARAQGVHHALVFHSGVAPPAAGLSWAYFPPCNGPRLDDDLLFLRLALAPDGSPAPSLDLWKRRFPDRSAWYYGYLDGVPRLVPLTELEGAGARAPR
jgi:hypothetical protein